LLVEVLLLIPENHHHPQEAANKGSFLEAASGAVTNLGVGEGRAVQPGLMRLTGFDPVALSSGDLAGATITDNDSEG